MKEIQDKRTSTMFDVEEIKKHMPQIATLDQRTSFIEAAFRERTDAYEKLLLAVRDLKSAVDVMAVQQIATRESVRRVEDRLDTGPSRSTQPDKRPAR
jgi:hypothetical protein